VIRAKAAEWVDVLKIGSFSQPSPTMFGRLRRDLRLE
jgi:hypothetical protein